MRRKDSFGLIFSIKPTIQTVCDVIFENLGLDYSELIGYQLMTRNRAIVRFKSRSSYDKFVNEYEGKELQIDNGSTVKIVNMGTSFSFVSIRYATFEMDNHMLESVLRQYGKVIWIRNNQHTTGNWERSWITEWHQDCQNGN